MATPVVMPKLGMVMSEGVVLRWTRPAGEAVRTGETIAEIETEKIGYSLEASADGIVHPLVAEGTTLPVGGLMGYLLAEGEAAPGVPERAGARAPAAAPESGGAPRPAAGAGAGGAPPPAGESEGAGAVPSGTPGPPRPSTPGARKLAARLGVELALVAATGPAGRVTEADVRTFSERGPPPGAPGSGAPARSRPPPAAQAPLPPGFPAPSQSAPLTRMRKAIADHLRESLASTAQLSFFLEVDLSEAQRRRRELSAERGIRLTLADLLIKACARALARVPALNSRLCGGSIHRFDAVNMGIAVALDEGLVVPVVRNVEAMDIATLARATRDAVERARSGRLRAADLAGGTFTISVLGIVDGFTPILNAGQTAILGAGRCAPKPVVKEGAIVIREMATLSLSVDHQVVDGASAAAFLRRLQQALERPKALFVPAADDPPPRRGG